MQVQEGNRPRAVSATVRDTRRRVVFAMIVLFLAAGLVATFTVTASGQRPNYDVIKLNPAFEQPANLKRMQDAAKRIAGTRDDSFPQRNVAEAFFKTYVPAKITQPDATTEITPLIDEVMLRMSAAQRSKSSFASAIMGWVYRGLKPVAVGNYQPAARISAIVAISRIDEKPADLGKSIPPTPLRYIVTDFLPIYEDEKNPDGVRAAALQGIHRYVMFAAPSVTGANLTKLKSLMNDLLTQDPPADRSPKAHAYLQRFAVDILSALRGKSDPVLGQQLISISTEAKNPDLIALHSAARIGEMATDIRGKVDAPDQVLGQWTVRAMRAFQYEAIRLKALDRPRQVTPQPRKPRTVVRPATEPQPVPGRSMMDDGEGMDEGMEEEMMSEYGEGMMEMDDEYDSMMMMSPTQRRSNPQPPEVFVSRRKLNYILQQLHLGATGSTKAGVPSQPGGLLAGVADDKKADIETWVTSMGDVLTALNDETLDDRKKYIEGLLAQVEILRGIAGPAAEQAEAAAPLEIPNVSPVVAAAVTGKVEAVGSEPPPAADEADEAEAPKLPVEDELSFE